MGQSTGVTTFVGRIGRIGRLFAPTVILALAACADPASAPAREHASVGEAVAAAPAERRSSREEDRSDRGGDGRGGTREARTDDPRDLPTPMRDGRPMWTATSRLTAEENAERAFEQHGAELGVRDVDAYVARAHAFLKDPPADVLTITRTNGDKLYYAPGDNLFAVAREDGAPRTLFKPDEGMAYWREQQAREEERAEGGGRSRSREDRS